MLMRSKLLLPMLFAVLLTVPACGLLNTGIDPVTGKEKTKLENVLDKAKDVIDVSAPVVNAFVPGVGTIAGGVGMLMSLIGGLTTSIVVAKKRGNALTAVIKGVEIAANPTTKESIKEIAGSLGVEPYLNRLVRKYYPT